MDLFYLKVKKNGNLSAPLKFVAALKNVLFLRYLQLVLPEGVLCTTNLPQVLYRVSINVQCCVPNQSLFLNNACLSHTHTLFSALHHDHHETTSLYNFLIYFWCLMLHSILRGCISYILGREFEGKSGNLKLIKNYVA